jgi:hypothetical protein
MRKRSSLHDPAIPGGTAAWAFSFVICKPGHLFSELVYLFGSTLELALRPFVKKEGGASHFGVECN